MKRQFLVVATAAALAGYAVSALIAFEFGAGAGVSGGPAGQAATCTACHEFNAGAGGAELIGAPRRYRAGVVYDLSVNIEDAERIGAGFEISAESPGGHVGAFLISDADHTRSTGSEAPIQYVTHTRAGFADSVDNWITGGGMYAYSMQWQAPDYDAGPVTFFVAANTAHEDGSRTGEHFYTSASTARYALPGDADGDDDIDLHDFAMIQRCLDESGSVISDNCRFVDLDGDEQVILNDAAEFASALSGPTAPLPAEYILADSARGGMIYDKWWEVNGAVPPIDNHPLWYYRSDTAVNTRAGAETWRCKECHGWDYRGADGVYGDPQNDHHTGFGGVLGTTLSPHDMFDLLKADDPGLGGHDMDAAGMTDQDIWDVVKMVLEDALNTDEFIDQTGSFRGDADRGLRDYDTACASCHGADGLALPAIDLPAIAVTNPWEFLHKTRFGQPGSAMPAFELIGWGATRAANVGAYAAAKAP